MAKTQEKTTKTSVLGVVVFLLFNKAFRVFPLCCLPDSYISGVLPHPCCFRAEQKVVTCWERQLRIFFNSSFFISGNSGHMVCTPWSYLLQVLGLKLSFCKPQMAGFRIVQFTLPGRAICAVTQKKTIYLGNGRVVKILSMFTLQQQKTVIQTIYSVTKKDSFNILPEIHIGAQKQKSQIYNL